MGAFNYFNYFTEIEEYFWKKRGAHLLVSPLDWAIVETWQKAGIPLSAVLKGIDRAFESYSRSRRAAAGRQLKSLTYCVDAVLESAAESAEANAGSGPERRAIKPVAEAFSRDDLRSYFSRNRLRLERAAEAWRSSSPNLAAQFDETARRLQALEPSLDSPARLDLEDLERCLTVLEERLTAAITVGSGEELMLEIRCEMDRALAPYRRKMSAEQLALLERQYLQKRLYEAFDLPRLSLFYLT